LRRRAGIRLTGGAAHGDTTVRTTAAIFGPLAAGTIKGYRSGGLEVLTALKAHLEAVRVGQGGA
jgi:hypothetical protein